MNSVKSPRIEAIGSAAMTVHAARKHSGGDDTTIHQGNHLSVLPYLFNPACMTDRQNCNCQKSLQDVHQRPKHDG